MITIPGKLSYSNFESQLPNLTPEQIFQLNNSISIAPDRVVGLRLNNITKGTDKTFSIRLMKWVEPYNIGGFNYSLFYTEVDHNFKVGDRCFIEGGFYDSDLFIESNGYNQGVDGYKVLYVDRTKIVLDIPFTGDLPTNEEEIDNFVKVYVANTQYEFDFYCQMLSMRRDTGSIENRFQLGLNNFLYLNGTFSINPVSYDLQSFASDFALTSTPTTLSNSWVIRGTTASNNYMVDITNDVLTNNITPYLNSSYTQSNSGFFNLEKLRIMNSKFTSGVTNFMNERIYYFDTNQNKWRLDKTYLPTIITENHFKGGFFDSGSFNQGLYGVHEERLEWSGDNVNWNLGTTLNVDWLSGTLDSQIYDPDSFFTIFDRNGLPQIRANAENNGGAGYNYVFNTEFSGGDIINGNIFNMSTIIGTNSSTQSTLLNYYTGQTQSYSVELKGGVYYNSEISFATMSNLTFISSYVLNSYINRCKSVNSEVEASVFLNSDWLSDRIVKIQAYEESNIVWYDETSNPVDYKMYKFYVTDTNWRRLREFQNFYIDGIGINIPSDELLRFFDDKFSLGHWFQTYDIIGSKPERRVLIQLSTKEENRNSPGEIISLDNDLQPNFDNPLPSVDVFISGGDDFNYGASTSYPRPFIAQTIDIERGYIIDSDFISGLFKDSRWISGNYFNYNQDVSFSSGSGYTASVTASTAELELNIGGDWRPNIIGTTSDVSNIAFVNGLWYDSTLNGGSNLVKLPDVYKVNSIVGTSSRQIVLQDILTQSVLNTFGNFTDQPYLITPNASNQWNYIHPVKFENSIIYSGVFRRAYFEGCLFENFEFDVTDKDLEDVTNKRKLLVSDVIFDGDNNEIRNGLFQYSHMVGGNDNWKGGIFHRGVWNTEPFTYSLGPTSSFTYQNSNHPFKNGILRNTTWENGIFENGTFYKNKSNVTGTSSVFNDSRQVYYYEGFNTRWTWKMGDFINGDFERSNFEMGNFFDGNFYDSDFFIGEATGGNFGKSNIPFEKTRIWEGTFSNVNVINANFRSGYVEDSTNTSNSSLIYWNSGIFRSGVFGTIDDVNYDPTDVNNNRSIWVDGSFKGGDFKDSAEWKGGQFDGGRFLSYYWYEPLNPRTPFELNTFTSASFSWQGGKFNGGQFGTGETSSNSTWYTGEFNGGLFQGRYWKDGIFTRGDFEGHAASYSTDIDNYNSFINSFNTYYYGYWQDGFVSKVKDKFVKNEKIFTEIERVSTKKKKNPLINFKNMFWNFGTFSSFDGSMDNSVWFNGTFQDGYFENSVFNPYVNHALPLFVDGTFSNGWVNSGASASSNGNNLIIENYSFTTSSLTLPYSLFENQVYTIQLEVVSNTNMRLDVEGVTIVSSGSTGIISGTFSADDVDLELEFINGGEVIEFTNLIVYPGTQSGFRIGDSCIWENGEAYSSDFYFSKWKQGIFDSFADSLQGNAWGLIWQDGITKYMNAYNVFWEGGIWKNGNWFGSPFQQIATYYGYQVYPGFSEDIMNNVADYASFSQLNSWDSIHMNDTFTGSLSPEILKNPEFDLGLTGYSGTGWTFDTTYKRVSGGTVQNVVDNNITSDANNSTVIFENTSSDDEVFSTTFSQYVIEVEWAAFIQKSFISTPPNPVLNLRIDIGYVGSSTIDDTSSNGGIRRFVGGGLKGSSITANTFIGSISRISTFNYTPTNLNNIDSKRLRITRMSHTGDSFGMEVYIKRISVKTFDYSYDLMTNNELYLGSLMNPSIGSPISLPSSIIYQIGELKSRFGNGIFRSGIWENGVWNEGWRDDETVLWSDNLDIYIGGKNQAYKDDKDIYKWTLKLNIPTGNQSPNTFDDFEIGDKVSVGNIILIDINENRRLIKDYLIITDKFEGLRNDPSNPFGPQINSQILTLELQTTFLIRRIEKDSDVHLIHISKNVWLNGVFLNGKFLNGVWTNGLFTGFPYITEMYDTHWVDGIYKGGRFTGTTSVYIDNKGNSNEYHKSVIQRFIFSDENVSGQPFKFKYNSWIDVNYFETSGVNINRVNETYVQTPLFYTASYIDSNHYGYPTMDVLESISSIRNAFDLNSRNYKLGWKFKEYTDWIPYSGDVQFNGINQFNWVNSPVTGYTLVPNILSGLTSGLGTVNLDSLGFDFYYGPGAPFLPGVETEIINNYGSLPVDLQNKLIIKGGSIIPGVQNPVGPENYNLDFIDNNNIDIERLRYSFVEITADNLGTIGNPYVFYNNFPGTYSIPSRSVSFGGSTVSLPLNQVFTASVVNQREYFFNKKGLEMSIISGNTTQSIGSYSLAFDKIRLVETDMIPFFQFATDCFVERSLEIGGEDLPTIEDPELVEPPIPQENCGEGGITLTLKTDETVEVSEDFFNDNDLFIKLFLEIDFYDLNGNPVYYNEDWSNRLEVRYNDTQGEWEFVRYPEPIEIQSTTFPIINSLNQTARIQTVNAHGLQPGDQYILQGVQHGSIGGTDLNGPIWEVSSIPGIYQFLSDWSPLVQGSVQYNIVVNQTNAFIMPLDVTVLATSSDLLSGWQISNEPNRFWNQEPERYNNLDNNLEDTVIEVVGCVCGNQTSEFVCATGDSYSIKMIPMYLSNSNLPVAYSHYGGSESEIIYWTDSSSDAPPSNQLIGGWGYGFLTDTILPGFCPLNSDNIPSIRTTYENEEITILLQPGSVLLVNYTVPGSLSGGTLEDQIDDIIIEINNNSLGIVANDATSLGCLHGFISLSGPLQNYNQIQVIFLDEYNITNTSFIPIQQQVLSNDWTLIFESTFTGIHGGYQEWQEGNSQSNPPNGVSYPGDVDNFLLQECGNELTNTSTVVPPIQLPIVQTIAVSNISSSAANSGGNIISQGGQAVTLAGVVWSTSPNPTVGNSPGGGSSVVSNPGLGQFIILMNGLQPNTTYYYRAFASNAGGTYDGVESQFTTSAEGFILSNVDQGECLVSYINSDIQVPYTAKAPDIDYTDLNFNLLNNVNIYIPNVNINTVQVTEDPITNNVISFPDSSVRS